MIHVHREHRLIHGREALSQRHNGTVLHVAPDFTWDPQNTVLSILPEGAVIRGFGLVGLDVIPQRWKDSWKKADKLPGVGPTLRGLIAYDRVERLVLEDFDIQGFPKEGLKIAKGCDDLRLSNGRIEKVWSGVKLKGGPCRGYLDNISVSDTWGLWWEKGMPNREPFNGQWFSGAGGFYLDDFEGIMTDCSVLGSQKLGFKAKNTTNLLIRNFHALAHQVTGPPGSVTGCRITESSFSTRNGHSDEIKSGAQISGDAQSLEYHAVTFEGMPKGVNLVRYAGNEPLATFIGCDFRDNEIDLKERSDRVDDAWIKQFVRDNRVDLQKIEREA